MYFDDENSDSSQNDSLPSDEAQSNEQLPTSDLLEDQNEEPAQAPSEEDNSAFEQESSEPILTKASTKKQKPPPVVPGSALNPLPSVTEAESEKYKTPTLSEAISLQEFEQQNHDPLLAWTMNARGKAYLSSLLNKGKMLTPEEYKNSQWVRPGLAEKYPKGLSTGQAEAEAHLYDIDQTIQAQLANLPSYKYLTSAAVASNLTMLNDPKLRAVGAAGAVAGAALSGVAAIDGTLAAAREAMPGLTSFLEDTAVGRSFATGAKTAGGMALLTAPPAIQYAARGSLPAPVNALPSPYGYLDATKDIIQNSVYAAPLGVAGHLLLAEPIKMALTKAKPSEILKNTTSSSDHAQTAQDLAKEVTEPIAPTPTVSSKAPNPFPEELQKYASEEGRQPQATPEEIKGQNLVGSKTDLPEPQDFKGGYAEFNENDHPLASSPEENLDNARNTFNSAIQEHNQKFEGIEDEFDHLNIKDLPDSLDKSDYRLKKYLNDENSLPYVLDAVKYLKNSDEAKPVQQKAYEAIKNGEEDQLLKEYISRTEKSVSSYEKKGDTKKLEEAQQTLQVLQARQSLLDRHTEFGKSLDHLNNLKQNYYEAQAKMDINKGFGKPLLSPEFMDALSTQAEAQLISGREMDVRGAFKAGLADSPLLKGEVPEHLQELKDYANNHIPTSDDIREDFGDSKPYTDEPEVEKSVSELEGSADQNLEMLEPELKEGVDDAVKEVENTKNIFKEAVKDALSCLTGGK